jgi:hypothetical protein
VIAEAIPPPSPAGDFTAVQLVPSKCSNKSWISPPPPFSITSDPAAHRSFGPVPAMAVSESPSPGTPVTGFGLGATDQVVPFQCSIRVND